jgi:hypothetical protein
MGEPMSDIEELMKLYKEIQENYIKAIERENEELRKQREKDALKIEELEKEIQQERVSKYIKNVPSKIDEQTIIGPGNGWGYPQSPVIWTSNNTSTAPPTIGGSAATGTSGFNPTYTSYTSDVQKYKEAYTSIEEKIKAVTGIDVSEEYKRMFAAMQARKLKDDGDDN